MPYRTLEAIYPENPKSGDLVVWNRTNDFFDLYSIDSINEAKLLIRKLVKEQLDSIAITESSFGLHKYIPYTIKSLTFDNAGEGWQEWYDDDGMRITEIIDEEDAYRQETFEIQDHERQEKYNQETEEDFEEREQMKDEEPF